MEHFVSVRNLVAPVIMLALAGFIGTPASAESWARHYGGGSGEGADDVLQTSDGGFVAAGFTKSFGVSGYSDSWIVRTDGLGNVLWERAYKGFGRDQVSRLQATADGGYLGIGLGNSYSGVSQHAPEVLKLDASGNIVLQQIYVSSGRDWGDSIKETSDGSYVIAGATDPTLGGATYPAILKLAADGTITWQFVTLTTKGSFTDVVETADGGYLTVGSINAGSGVALVVKFDTNGSISWQQTYGTGSGERINRVIRIADGFVLAGSTGSDAWVYKIDSTGSVVWEKSYGGPGSDYASSIVQTADGGYAWSGSTTSFGAAVADLWVVKLDALGEIVWQRRYDAGGPEDAARSLRQTMDGGYIVAGFGDPGCNTGCSSSADPDYFTLLKLEADGSVAGSCQPGVGDPTSAVAQPTSVSVQNPGLTTTVATFTAQTLSLSTVPTDADVTELCAAPPTDTPTDTPTTTPTNTPIPPPTNTLTPTPTNTVSLLCGNAVVDAGEQCDLGAANCPVGQCCGSGCVSTCKATGRCTGSQACCTTVADCASGHGCCGNGVIESGEQCDDGNLQNDDCCSNTCQVEALPCVPLPDVCAGTFGPHLIANPTIRQTLLSKSRTSPGGLDRWTTRGQFNLFDGQTIDPVTEVVQYTFSQNNGANQSTNLYAPVLDPAACPDGRCFVPRTNPQGLLVRGTFRLKRTAPDIMGAPGWRAGKFSRFATLPSRFSFQLSGSNAVIGTPQLLNNIRRVRQSIKIGDDCITRALDCAPNSSLTRFTCKEVHCGNGVKERAEQCGEPSLPACAAGRVCDTCRCVMP